MNLTCHPVLKEQFFNKISTYKIPFITLEWLASDIVQHAHLLTSN